MTRLGAGLVINLHAFLFTLSEGSFRDIFQLEVLKSGTTIFSQNNFVGTKYKQHHLGAINIIRQRIHYNTL